MNVGKGKCGPVDLIICQGEFRVVKKIKKESIDNNKRIEHIKQEKKLLQSLNKQSAPEADFIVKLYETFTDRDYICLVFEYLNGQDLFWVLTNEHNLQVGKSDYASRKQWVMFYCAEILTTLKWLHKNHIIYRDLKPDNVMIDSEGHIKLIDFGFAKKLSQTSQMRTSTNCGTIGYTAPEVISEGSSGYSFSADVWSFGIVIAELLTG